MRRIVAWLVAFLLLANLVLTGALYLVESPTIDEPAWHDLGYAGDYRVENVTTAPQDPFILRDATGTFDMWFSEPVPSGSGSVQEIYQATSSDGFLWRAIGPVINGTRSTYGLKDVRSPFVQATSDGWEMWFQGSGGALAGDAIYHASFGGFLPKWTVDAIVLPPGGNGSWDSGGVGRPWLMGSPIGARLYYFGYNRSAPAYPSGIGVAPTYAGSLYPFSRSSQPVFTAGPVGAWDRGAFSSYAVLAGTPTSLYYVAGGQIGNATSVDGVEWTRSVDNPIHITSNRFAGLDWGGFGTIDLVDTGIGLRIYFVGTYAGSIIETGTMVPTVVQVPGPKSPIFLPLFLTSLAGMAVLAADSWRSRPKPTPFGLIREDDGQVPPRT